MRVPTLPLAALMAALTGLGCGGGSGGTTTPTNTTAVPASMTKTAGDAQTAVVGLNVSIAPSVTVLDSRGVGVGNTAVTFTVASGGGTVVGGTATTSSAGVATVGSWRLGATPGANTLTVAVAGLAAETFTATAIADPCTTTTPLAFGATTTGALAATDCLLDNQYYGDLYSFTVPAGQRAQLDLSSGAFDPWLDLAGPLVTDYTAFDDNSGGGTSPRIRLISPPGAFIATVNSFSARQTGAYSFSVTNWSGDAAACEEDVWIVPSATVIPQTIGATDCSFTGTGGPFLGDGFNFIAIGGRTYTITMASSAVDPSLRLFNGITGAQIATDDNGGGGTTARVTFSPTATTMAVLLATTAVGGTTGAYSLTVAGPAGADATVLGAPFALIRPPAKGRAIRRPASAAIGAPWVFQQAPLRTAEPAARRP